MLFNGLYSFYMNVSLSNVMYVFFFVQFSILMIFQNYDMISILSYNRIEITLYEIKRYNRIIFRYFRHHEKIMIWERK